ncbi:MAG: MFS transporter [Desulfobacteraceae bacterium]|nr:MFS transporter [Desulfobacteraceae bacterium]
MKPTDSIPLKVNLGYNLGQMGSAFAFSMAAMYLTYFFTDYLKIGAAMAGTLFLVARVWDALNDPIMGYLVDKTHTRWGRFRPYILFGTIPMSVFFALCFYVPDLSLQGRIIWAFAIYIPLGMIHTVTLIPWHAQMVVLTKDPSERSGIAGIGMVMLQIATFIVATLTIPLKNLFPGENGFFYMACIYATFSAIGFFICFASTREYDRPENYLAGGSNATSGTSGIRGSLKMIVDNKPFLILILAFFLVGSAITLTQATLIFFFRYYLCMEGLFSPVMGGFIIATGAGAMVMTKISRKRGKRQIYLVGSLGFSGFMVLIFSVFVIHGTAEPFSTRFILFFSALVMIAGFFNGPIVALIWSMMPDTVEYGEWKTGVRAEGLLYSVFSLTQKTGAAVGGALTGYLLAFFKYVPNQPQTEETKFGLLIMLFIWPAVIQMLAFGIILFYDLAEDRHREMVGVLEQRKENQNV